eukprot:CAMPEP_0204870496 /NCGR_PEP_ID=MMETSP1348-20121228/32606_1 /ASSEMBLY_ACC=CAM_ASM_000700 /TAXON_ID=215587 /ORGANISM="Aplanochytrium stocchinoi, Strain GSBS06" /LENGTH=109 /DNA_ID=CAMNT_0052024321 /DNA_START=781 /DNA_END=1110 /DNA_ORIENTATION=+
MFWHILVAIYGNFGYEGLFGIIIGFVSITVAFVAFFLLFTTQESMFGARAFGRGLYINFGSFRRGTEQVDDANDEEVDVKPERDLDDFEVEADADDNEHDTKLHEEELP